jgi:hypothetical protein
MPVEGILDHGVTLGYPRHLREEKTKFMTVKYKQPSRGAMITGGLGIRHIGAKLHYCC